MFKNTSEYAYLSVLCDLHNTLLEMLGNNEFTDKQLVKLLSKMDYVNEILNMDRNSLNTASEDMN